MARDARRFQRGSGVYTCRMCDRQTRSTGRGDNEFVQMCAECYDLSGSDNEHNDNDRAPTAKEMVRYEALLDIIRQRGGNVEKVKDYCEFIWSD